MASKEATIRVSLIFIHSIKSCCSIIVSSREILGFRLDKYWLAVNSKGRAYTQKVEPKLALVEVQHPSDAFPQGWVPTKSSHLAHTLTTPSIQNTDEHDEPPISDEIFKSSPKSGSYKLGDSTFFSLIENYANLGDLRSLDMVFDRMKREQRVFRERIFILVFKAYGRAHLPEMAVKLFDRMVDEFQCKRTVCSFNSVLNVIIQEGHYNRALEFHSYVIKTKNILPNFLTFNLIIKTLCRLGLIDRAIETFREMTSRKCNPDVFTYSTIMDGLCKENRIDEAVSLLDEMQIEGCFPSSVTFNVLINGLCKKGDMLRASKLVENMFLKGCCPNEVTYNTLIHGLCLKGKLDKAISLLDQMVSKKCVPNIVTYGTIINGLTKQGRAIDGARVLNSMEERGHEGNEYIYSAIVSGFLKEGKPKEALRFWKEVIEKGCKPNTVLYSTLIDGLCREGKPEKAKEILSEMTNKGCIPNAFAYSSLMKGFFEAGDSHGAILAWKEMENNKITCNEVCYSVLIHGLCEDGKLKDAMMVWKHMLGRGCKPDVVAYTSMIHGFCNSGLVEQGLKLLHEMLYQEPAIQPDVVTYNILFHGFYSQSSIPKAIDLLHSMIDRGCKPDLVTCNIFLKILREKLHPPQNGREFLDELVVRLLNRHNVVAASEIVGVMLQKYLAPKTSTWERTVKDICKPKKIQAAINKCWSILCSV